MKIIRDLPEKEVFFVLCHKLRMRCNNAVKKFLKKYFALFCQMGISVTFAIPKTKGSSLKLVS